MPGLFQYLFMFWLHRHLLAKHALNSKQSTRGYERIIREILRRSGCSNILSPIFYMMLIFTQTLSIFYRRKWLGSFVIRFFLQHHQTWRIVFEIMTIAQSFTPMSFSFECIIQCILQHDTYIFTNMSPDAMMIYFLAFYILNIVNTFIPKSIRSFI